MITPRPPEARTFVVTALAVRLPDPRNAIVLVGFQAEGTRGRLLLQGVRHLKIFGEYVPVRAEVVELPALSVHADANELVEWVAATPTSPGVVYAVHGEPEASCVIVFGAGSEARLPSRRTPTPRARRRTPQLTTDRLNPQ